MFGDIEVGAGSGDRDRSALSVLPIDPSGEGDSVGDVDRDGDGMMD